MKMKHSGYIELTEEMVRSYYSDDDYRQYKGYRLLAIDGSRIQLPNRDSVKEEFGVAENWSEKPIPMATSSIAYDILNHMVVSMYLDKYNADERALASKHLDKIRELTPRPRDIILMDRGYPSLYLFTKMVLMGYDFIMRCNDTSFIKEVKDFAQSEKTDKIIEIDLTLYHRKANPELQKLEGKPDRLKLRVLKIKLSTGETEYIISSLIDKTKVRKEEFKELYHLRWGEETYFNYQKNVLELENFSGRNPETIKQDYYA